MRRDSQPHFARTEPAMSEHVAGAAKTTDLEYVYFGQRFRSSSSCDTRWYSLHGHAVMI